MSKTGIFAPGAPSVWTIPPGTDFLGALSATLAEEFNLNNHPAALADALIYVPNRRSARALALALHKQAGGNTILPPDIRALGDLETQEPPSGAEEALTHLGPALSPARRLGTLASLVQKFYQARGLSIPPTSILAAARELGRLLDSASLAGSVDWGRLPDLVQETDLAEHWADSVTFLKIVTEDWPKWLAKNGASDPFDRRLQVAHAVANRLRTRPPKGPFIVAGSTGATPATQQLMLAAQAMPQGLVILPGLDLDAPASMWTEITERRADKFAGAPDHPQFSLAGTLKTLELTAQEVPIWPHITLEAPAHARRRLLHESLAPASQTADWLARLNEMAAPNIPHAFATQALSGLTILEAEDEAEEALFAALALREALETPSTTAALITPDAGLARQVSALLKRWDLDVPPSSGIPLGRTPAGSLALLALNWAIDTGNPVALTALLKHSYVDVDANAVEALEINYLRGPRRWQDLSDLLASLSHHTQEMNASQHTRLSAGAEESARALLIPLQKLADKALPLSDPDHAITGTKATEYLVALINGLSRGTQHPWAGRDGEAVSQTLESAIAVTEHLAHLNVRHFTEIFEALTAGVTISEDIIPHPQLSIWGPLEARLQTADRIILAGLNETVWPNYPQADAFLPRRFRKELGLPAPEARLGLAAHDFAQLACAPNVTMLYSGRRDDAPAVASRWILRLKTLSEGALGQQEAVEALAPQPARDLKLWAKALTRDRQTIDAGKSEPKPTPPLSARPKQLSVTRIDTLQRDPYAIYAGNILKLKKLDALNAELDARPRGTAIHKALEDFDTAPTSEQTAHALHARILHELRAAGEPEHLILANRAAYAKTAQEYFAWWTERQQDLKNAWPEIRGAITFTVEGEPFKLSGTADRIEQHGDGTYSIIDFKTGKGKTRKQIEAGFEQQLPFLSLIARDGEMQDANGTIIPQAPSRAFGYVSVRFRFEASPITKSAEDADDLTDNAKEMLIKLITEYRAPDVIYRSVPRIKLKSQYAGDYDHLARRLEWAGEASDGDD